MITQTQEQVKDIIKNYKGTWGLITSASHMPRSYFGFKKQGLILEPIIVDYKTGTSPIFWINFNIGNGLSNWSTILHEDVGISYYKIIRLSVNQYINNHS